MPVKGWCAISISNSVAGRLDLIRDRLEAEKGKKPSYNDVINYLADLVLSKKR